MTSVTIRNPGKSVLTFSIDRMIPATRTFPYWTFYLDDNDERVAFHSIEAVSILELKEEG